MGLWRLRVQVCSGTVVPMFFFYFLFFFFNDTATTEIYTLSLHDALPILTMIPESLYELNILQSVILRSIASCK